MAHPLLSLAALVARLTPMPLKQALYRVRPLARLIRRSLNRAAPQGMGHVTVAGGLLAGATLELDLQEEKDYWLGTYEADLQAALAAFVQPDMTVYDVGANIGYISLLIARRAGERGRVIAFEALPANVSRLRANLALNGMQNRVEVIQAAVSDRSEPVQFLLGPSSAMGKVMGSAGRTKDYAEAIIVEGLALDDFVFAQGYPVPQVVKMDIEGGEVLALPGMRRLLKHTKPVILLELHGPQAAQTAWNELTPLGYQFTLMSPGFQPIATLEEFAWKSYVIAHVA
jgi:FkbM family methyltransferase